PRRLVASRADRHDVREVDRRFLLDDASRLLHAARLRVALDQVHPLDDHPAALVEHAQDLPGLAAFPAGDDHDGIVSPQPTQRHDQSTSGASEMIFMNFLARSSRATGPKMRVPIGSRALSMSTAEFVSKRM